MSKRSEKNPYWQEVCQKFSEKNIEIYEEPQDCEISVVLGGTLENPLGLRGRKVLAYREEEWRMLPWAVYQLILEEYYDRFIGVTGLSADDAVYHIRKKCENL